MLLLMSVFNGGRMRQFWFLIVLIIAGYSGYFFYVYYQSEYTSGEFSQ